MSDAQQPTELWTNKQLMTEAEVVVVGRFGIEPVYKLLKRVRDDSKAFALRADSQPAAQPSTPLQEIVAQLRLCNYTCEAGSLRDNAAWRALERMAAQQPDVPQPEWDKHPWANYACLVPFSGGIEGIFFMWYYWEVKPEWGERSYNWVDGKWGPANPIVTKIPLSAVFDVRRTLQQRPQEAE